MTGGRLATLTVSKHEAEFALNEGFSHSFDNDFRLDIVVGIGVSLISRGEGAALCMKIERSNGAQ